MKIIQIIKSLLNFSPLEYSSISLIIECKRGNLKNVEKIVKSGISPNFYIKTYAYTPLLIALKDKRFDIADILLKHGADINFTNPRHVTLLTPLNQAIYDQDAEKIYYVIRAGANLNLGLEFQGSPLLRAVRSQNLAIIKILVDAGAHIDFKQGYWDKTPLHQAILLNNKEIVTYLIEKGAKSKQITKIPRHTIKPAMVRFLKENSYL